MAEMERLLLRTIQSLSERRAADFATEFVRAAPADKEILLAGLEFENWLAESCREALGGVCFAPKQDAVGLGLGLALIPI